MFAKIYSPKKSAMQSGRSRKNVWLLEFDETKRRSGDPLMGWTSAEGGDASNALKFESKDAAVRYAEKNGIPFYVVESQEPVREPKTYSDNFAFKRRQPWTH
ncbi:MAG: ETC complex I subunit [Marinicaulis sp.]|nr:ETC complex I subunit [Marinicaulis sp.]NNE41047.1 ETC complex I subunit [Marinicaulis sp.]NNL89987.1 ETC complex I subunit [Marinicaulis sp.]